MIVRRDREGGESRDILTDSTLEQIIGILLHNSEQTLKTAEEGKGEDQLTSFTLELTLSILESYTVALSNLSPDQEKLVRKLSCLGALLESLSDFEDSPKNRGICVLLVRLILNLTNNEAAICERFSTPPLVKALSNIVVNEIPKISGEASVDDVEAVTDFVILSLGCLINLSECSERFRSLFASTKHGSDLCLDILVTYFIDGKDSASEADNFEQMRFNVVLGYLSVFLCTLCLDDDIHKQLSKQLQHNGVDQLLGTVEEFLKYHKKVEEEVRDGMGHQDSNTTFIARLQGIVDRVRGGGTAH
ncbi:hypothetical protein KEM55_004505 [Ascosphaera atra]|nr:hypothetical protein KEM55_004505 [Ascosphaera atra]